MKPPNPRAFFASIPCVWHPAAQKWRKKRGPVLANDIFARALERLARRKSRKKLTPPPPSWADKSQPPERE